MRRIDRDKLKRTADVSVFEEATYVEVVQRSISSGSSGYDIFRQEETVTEYRSKVPAFISWVPKVRYVDIGGAVSAKNAAVTLTGIPIYWLSKFTDNVLVEVPNDDLSSSSSCQVLSVQEDDARVTFSVFLTKRE